MQLFFKAQTNTPGFCVKIESFVIMTVHRALKHIISTASAFTNKSL